MKRSQQKLSLLGFRCWINRKISKKLLQVCSNNGKMPCLKNRGKLDDHDSTIGNINKGTESIKKETNGGVSGWLNQQIM